MNKSIIFPQLYYTDCHNILISASFGRTSAMMLKLMMDDPYWRSKRLLIAFANTGLELEETLIFGKEVEENFGVKIIWVEAVVDEQHGKGTRHRFVTFETASRKGEPFEDVIKKYGISNAAFPHCTRELKQQPLDSLCREFFNGEPYVSALGFRFDEIGRVKPGNGDVYPMAAWGLNVSDVRIFWNKQSFDLQLKDYQGNCDLCWKKSVRKKLTILQENPSIADWWIRMEEKYSDADLHGKGVTAYFHRNNQSTNELLAMAKKGDFIPVTDPFWKQYRNEEMDSESPCSCSNFELVSD